MPTINEGLHFLSQSDKQTLFCNRNISLYLNDVVSKAS